MLESLVHPTVRESVTIRSVQTISRKDSDPFDPGILRDYTPSVSFVETKI
jgi:hypothetical protein